MHPLFRFILFSITVSEKVKGKEFLVAIEILNCKCYTFIKKNYIYSLAALLINQMHWLPEISQFGWALNLWPFPNTFWKKNNITKKKPLILLHIHFFSADQEEFKCNQKALFLFLLPKPTDYGGKRKLKGRKKVEGQKKNPTL